MLALIYENAGTVVVGLLVAAAVAAIIRGMIRSRKKGGSSCGCAGCAGCSGCSGGCER